ncbi:MAG TPA: hypothetical protein PLO50_01945 [Nitrospira sp.]|nr:hypothetical protein [Nitrospira sp.]
MNSFVKVARMLGGMILFLGLINVFEVGNAASAAKKMQNSPCEVPDGTNAAQAEKDAKQGGHMVSGEVLRVEGTDYVVKNKDGKEVRFQVDQGTEKTPINLGDRISASVDNQNRALWIRANRGTDRRTEHASADCNPTEDVSSHSLKQSGNSMNKDR